jgi:hypothetical protein
MPVFHLRGVLILQEEVLCEQATRNEVLVTPMHKPYGDIRV